MMMPKACLKSKLLELCIGDGLLKLLAPHGLVHPENLEDLVRHRREDGLDEVRDDLPLLWG